MKKSDLCLLSALVRSEGLAKTGVAFPPCRCGRAGLIVRFQDGRVVRAYCAECAIREREQAEVRAEHAEHARRVNRAIGGGGHHDH